MSKRTISRMLFLVLVLGLTYGGLNLAGASVPGGPSVFVNNTSTNPVPVNVNNESVHVNGTVSVGNTPSVKLDPSGNTISVGNTPSVKLDTSGNTVTVGNTPSVKLDPTGNTVQLDPSTVLKTTAADNPAFQPVHGQLDAFFPDGQTGAATTAYTVPAGKELVIEQASFDAALPTGEDVAVVVLYVNGYEQNFLSPLHVGVENTQASDTSGSELTRVYAGPGSLVDCGFGRYPATGTGSFVCAFNGYLVNLP